MARKRIRVVLEASARCGILGDNHFFWRVRPGDRFGFRFKPRCDAGAGPGGSAGVVRGGGAGLFRAGSPKTPRRYLPPHQPRGGGH